MYEWPRLIQGMVDEIDRSILAHEEETLTLQRLSRDMGYSAYHATRKFREIAGMPLRDYLRRRRLAFALKEVRDSHRTLLDIAVDYGFSSHEAFTRAFKALYGVTPGGCAPGAIPASRATACGCPPTTTARCRRRWS